MKRTADPINEILKRTYYHAPVIRTELQYLNLLSLLGLIWTRQTSSNGRGQSYANQLATQYRFLREDA